MNENDLKRIDYEEAKCFDRFEGTINALFRLFDILDSDIAEDEDKVKRVTENLKLIAQVLHDHRTAYLVTKEYLEDLRMFLKALIEFSNLQLLNKAMEIAEDPSLSKQESLDLLKESLGDYNEITVRGIMVYSSTQAYSKSDDQNNDRNLLGIDVFGPSMLDMYLKTQDRKYLDAALYARGIKDCEMKGEEATNE